MMWSQSRHGLREQCPLLQITGAALRPAQASKRQRGSLCPAMASLCLAFFSLPFLRFLQWLPQYSGKRVISGSVNKTCGASAFLGDLIQPSIFQYLVPLLERKISQQRGESLTGWQV